MEHKGGGRRRGSSVSLTALALAAGAGLVGASPAHADDYSGPTVNVADITDLNFHRPGNTPVAERPHPEWDPLGIREGGFLIFPKVTLSGAYNDNIYASPSVNSLPGFPVTLDGIFSIEPSVTATSQWSRNFLQASAFARYDGFASHSTEDALTWGVSANGRLDVRRDDAIDAGLSYDHLIEPRYWLTTPGTNKPVRFDQLTAQLGARNDFDRWQLVTNVSLNRFTYENATDRATGHTVNETYRDENLWFGSARLAYTFTPSTAAFLYVSGNEHDFWNAPPVTVPPTPRPDSHGYEADAGVDFDLTHLLHARLQLGYLNQVFKDPLLRDVSGLSGQGRIQWYPTQLTTVTLTAGRSIGDTGLAVDSSYVATTSAVQVDHELLRNLILTGRLGGEWDDFRGASRRDTRFDAFLGGSYKLNRNAAVSLGYDRLSISSSGGFAGAGYAINQVTVSLVLQL